MTILSVDDVLSSGAVAILCKLERDGLTVELTPDDAISVAPRAAPDPRPQTADHRAQGGDQDTAALLRFRCEGPARAVREPT